MPSRALSLDRPEVLRVLFHPRRERTDIPLPPNAARVSIPVDADVLVGGRLFSAQPDAPAILLFHGNGEIASDYDDIAPWYTKRRISLLVVDYRGYGLSDGRPTAANLIGDAVPVYESTRALLRQHGLSDRRLFVMGRSLGSAAAIQVARHAGDRISGLIVESGFAYTARLLETLGLGRIAAADLDDVFDNLAGIAQVEVPTLVIHGQEDWLIPVENGRALHQQAGATDKQLVIIPGAGHNDLLLVGRSAYFSAISALVHPAASGGSRA